MLLFMLSPITCNLNATILLYIIPNNLSNYNDDLFCEVTCDMRCYVIYYIIAGIGPNLKLLTQLNVDRLPKGLVETHMI